MKKYLAAAITLVIAALASAGTVAARDIEGQYIHQGLNRDYLLHIPDSIEEGERRPLIVALHGGGGRADRFAGFSNLNAVAEQERVFVLYPQGFERHWNDGRGTTEFEAFARNVDDVGFLTNLIDYLDGVEIAVERDRVYATGISNGGMMALRLACESTRSFAAVAVVAANMPSRFEARCRPGSTMPVMIINGTHDRLIPYNGGTIQFGLRRLGSVLSTEETVRFWLDANNCADVPQEIREISDAEPDDRTHTEVSVYNDCRDNAEVVLYRIEFGGHTWPGGTQYLPERVIGKVSRDFSAEQAIWEFFTRHRRSAN